MSVCRTSRPVPTLGNYLVISSCKTPANHRADSVSHRPSLAARAFKAEAMAVADLPAEPFPVPAGPGQLAEHVIP